MQTAMTERAARRLQARAPLPPDPARSIAIKRDVHEFLVDADPRAFADAFAAVMTDPAGRFGLIAVRRPRDRVGEMFEIGERFQGCFSLPAALRLPDWRPLRWLARVVEDTLLSDYGEIVELDLQGPPIRLRYRYLAGTPLAGSTTFSVEPAERGCLVRQVFEYQEINGIALMTFQRLGLKLHDQVVHNQVHTAAARAGARVLDGTIPEAYATVREAA